ncbi:DUF4124 domain-containing protein [uncultured Ferrimonas sp.]|uniref:DUF4124 domain-containing protein n=1 Tax=uncultured Ferrimonas sp. TaxID=432640 RepID=UPI0026361A3C|nr:DUF4124 domain-containing protein [uncultured Ferrimonas sp.]
MKPTISAVALLLLLGSGGVQAAIYKCVTANGKVAFQDRPCANNQTREPLALKANVTNVASFGESATAAVVDDSSQTDRVIGRWHAGGAHSQVDADGGLSYTTVAGETVTGKWFRLGEEYRIALTYDGVPVPMAMQYRAAEDQLLLSELGSPEQLIVFLRQTPTSKVSLPALMPAASNSPMLPPSPNANRDNSTGQRQGKSKPTVNPLESRGAMPVESAAVNSEVRNQ